MVAEDHKDVEFASHFPLRILVADDDETNRRLMLIMLRNLGYKPESRTNGRACYEAVLQAPYDLLLTDIDMPEMDGIECARALRAAGSHVPIIAVTATAAEARADCLHAGMLAFMRKPISFGDLKRNLREVSLRRWLEQANRVVAGG